MDKKSNYSDASKSAVEIIPGIYSIYLGRLFWLSDTKTPKDLPNSFYFNVDHDLVYQPFYADFGPLNLGKTWKYIT
jgi:cell division cycle 14